MTTNLTKINDSFQLPIIHNSKTQKVDASIITDLELVSIIGDGDENNNNNNDTTGTKPIYNHVFQPKSKVGNEVLKQISSYYTTDTSFLSDTQLFMNAMQIKDVNHIYQKNNMTHFELDEMVKLVDEIKCDNGFCNKYLYVDWEFAKFMNNNSSFLQMMSIYNIASPIISLCIPIIILIIPFFVIKVKGIELSMKDYVDVLKNIISKHAVTRIFTDFNKVDFGQKMYLLISVAFYFFSIYQNILICVRFYSNMKKIHDQLFKMKQYLQFTIDSMDYHLSKSNNLSSFKDFNFKLQEKRVILCEFKENIECIVPFKVSFVKLLQVGHVMKTFYELYDRQDYCDAILFSFGFNGYLENVCGLKKHIDSGKMNYTVFVNDKKEKPHFKKMYYPKFVDDENQNKDEIVKNNCNLKKNIIITGPNASGKTTTLKSALLNVLLSQQIGAGCFEKCTMNPYSKIHCYLNIPDTSGRDSLFQAEARRCKEIIESISKPNSEETHFCIFDELYSGTNPEEAIISAKAFMEYLVKHDNVACMLTTHYTKLCKKLKKNARIENYHMETIKEEGDGDCNFRYTYLMKKGMSHVKGGLKVLKDMNYPKEIIDKTEE
jgi:hypothetical protein